MRNWLATIRENQGFSQTKIAQLVGVTRQMVSAIENGADPSVKTAKKIAEVLSVDWHKFYEDDEKAN